MKKFAILLVVMGLCMTAGAQNLLTNGDWATGDETGWTQWRASWGSGETWTVTNNGPTPPEGTLDSTTDNGSFGWYQNVLVPAGHDAQVSADWAGQVGGGGWVECMLITHDGSGNTGALADAGAASDIYAKRDSWGLNTPPTTWGWESCGVAETGGVPGGIKTSAGTIGVALKCGNTAVISFDNLVVVDLNPVDDWELY